MEDGKMGKILKNKSGKTDFLTLIGIGLIVWLLVGQSGSTGQSASGGTADGAQATPAANTVQIVGAPCTQSTTLTASVVRRYTDVAQTAQNVTILQNGVYKSATAHAGTTTIQSGPNADLLDLYPGLQTSDGQALTFYPRHLKGKLTTCTGSATTGDASFVEVDDETPGGEKVKYTETSGLYAAAPNKLTQIETAPTITIVNDGQATQNTGRDGQNLTIGAGGSGSVTVKLSPSANVGWGVNGNILACQFPSSVYDAANPVTVTVNGKTADPADKQPSLIAYPLIGANNTVKAYKFPGLDSKKTGDLTFSLKFSANSNNNPAGNLDRINCTIADVSYYQRERDGAYVLDIEDRDQNLDLGGANTVYDFEIGVA